MSADDDYQHETHRLSRDHPGVSRRPLGYETLEHGATWRVLALLDTVLDSAEYQAPDALVKRDALRVAIAAYNDDPRQLEDLTRLGHELAELRKPR